MKKKPTKSAKLPTHRVRELAAEANADPRTVADVLAGGRRDGMARTRIVAVLAKAGLLASLVVALALSGCRDSNGAPLSGGRAFFTRPGSANVAVVPYLDRDATASHVLDQGGVVLDAGGRAQVYLAEPATVRVEDSTGAQVDQFEDPQMTAALIEVRNAGFTGVDPVSGALVAGGRTRLDAILTNLFASMGGTDGYFRASANGDLRTVQSKFSEVQISVKDFGVKGDGAQDDTARAQAAYDYAKVAGAGVVYWPPGTYNISSAIIPTSVVESVGAGAGATIIRATNVTQNAFAPTVATQFSKLSITHATTSTGAAVSSASNVTMFLADITGGGFKNGIIVTGATAKLIGANIVAASAAGGFGVSGGGIYSVSSFVSAQSGVEIASGGVCLAAGSGFVGIGGAGLTLRSGAANSSMSGGYANGLVNGLVIEAGVVSQISMDDSVLISPAASDARAAAPVSYSFAVNSSITPLPLNAKAIYVNGTAGGITITVAATAAMQFGHKWTLYCINSSGAGVTWAFNAQYKLVGGAVPAPATGNMTVMSFEYDPLTAKNRELTRATMAI